MKRFLEKQLAHAEAKKLGATEYNYSVDKSGHLVRTAESCDAAKKPRNVRLAAIPAEARMGVKRP